MRAIYVCDSKYSHNVDKKYHIITKLIIRRFISDNVRENVCGNETSFVRIMQSFTSLFTLIVFKTEFRNTKLHFHGFFAEKEFRDYIMYTYRMSQWKSRSFEVKERKKTDCFDSSWYNSFWDFNKLKPIKIAKDRRITKRK